MSKHKFLFRHSSLYPKSNLARVLNPSSNDCSTSEKNDTNNEPVQLPSSSSATVLKNPVYQVWSSYDDNNEARIVENRRTEDIRNYSTTVSYLEQNSEAIYGDFQQQPQDYRLIQQPVQSDYYAGGPIPYYYNDNAYEAPQQIVPEETYDRQVLSQDEELLQRDVVTLTPNPAEFNSVVIANQNLCPQSVGYETDSFGTTFVVMRNPM